MLSDKSQVLWVWGKQVMYTQKNAYTQNGGSDMPKRIVPLTDTKILKTKPEQKQKALFDGGGLFLFVTPTDAEFPGTMLIGIGQC